MRRLLLRSRSDESTPLAASSLYGNVCFQRCCSRIFAEGIKWALDRRRRQARTHLLSSAPRLFCVEPQPSEFRACGPKHSEASATHPRQSVPVRLSTDRPQSRHGSRDPPRFPGRQSPMSDPEYKVSRCVDSPIAPLLEYPRDNTAGRHRSKNK